MRYSHNILLPGLFVFTAFLITQKAFANGSNSLEIWEAAPEAILSAQELELDSFMWRARPIVVFANTPFDPAYTEQIALLEAEIDELIARDVVIVTDTDPTAQSALRERLRPRGFMLVLIGKDGEVKLRKPFPWDVRELSRVIDKMPLRQQEMRR